MDTRLYWIWMQQALTPGSTKADGLLRRFGSAQAVYEAGRQEYFQTDDCPAAYELTKTELTRLENKSLDTAKAIFERSFACGCWLLTPEDKMYPSLLRAIPGVPLVLYGRGELPNLDLLPAIAVVGTREMSGYGNRVTALLAGGLALGGAVVISGGARGADAAAHEAALAAGGLTVAVQACGLDINYPSQNEELRQRIQKSGAVISEFPPGMAALRYNFFIRNRLISGLTLGTCVTEAPEKSGALITARLAFEQGRDVFAVAGDMLTGRSAGTDALIKQGARLITGAEEVLEEYLPLYPDILNPKAAACVRGDPRFRPKRNEPLKVIQTEKPETEPPVNPIPERAKLAESSPVRYAVCPDGVSSGARRVFDTLVASPLTLGELIGASGLSAAQVMTALTELEICECVCSRPGQIYALRADQTGT